MEDSLKAQKVEVNEKRFCLLSLSLVGITLLLCKLWQGDLRGDSLFYAEVAKEILKTGDWLTLYHGYVPYYNKPPLLFWLTAITFKIFGINTFSARLWSSLLALTSGLMFFLLLLRLFNIRTAYFSALVLFLTKDFIKDNMGLHLDSIVLLSIVGYLYFVWFKGPKLYIAGVFLALGLLGKGPQALYGPLIFFGVNLFLYGPRGFVERRFWLPLAIGIGSFIWWLTLMYLR